MNSLVVLFSVMVLASAKPSIPAIISYTAPTVAIAPAAVSHQSRIDVKSTPAILKTDIVAPAISPVVAPVAISAPLAAAPLAYSTPLAYTAPLAYSPIAYSGYTYPSIYTPAIAPAIPVLKTASMETEAEKKPEASMDDALPVAPTETPEVAAARAAHLEAKAFEEARHQIQKRAVSIVTSPLVSTYSSYPSPVIYPSPALTRIAPFGLPALYLTGAYGIHPY